MVRIKSVFGVLAASAMLGGNAYAASPLSGFWQLDRAAQKAPILTPWAKAQMAMVKRDGDMDVEATRWCVPQGMPHPMDSAGPIDIIAGSHEYTILSEKLAWPRHIYVDRRTHPSEDVFDHVGNGNSIGRQSKGVFIVDTTGFDAGVGPSGAPRTEASHLVERFRVTGDTLKVTSTWSDPKVFVKPYTYTLSYKRLPADHRPQEFYCDPRANGVGRN